MQDASVADAPLERARPDPAWPLKPWQEQGILFLLPFLLYASSLHFGLVYFDDDTYYLLNGALRGGAPEGLWTLWKEPFCGVYAPLTQLTLWLDLALFGTAHWWGPRLHGLLWFGLGTLAVRALVARLTGRREWGFWVALGFALHPVCAASVLWLAERKNLVCFALSLWCVERYLAANASRRAMAAALVLAVLAFLAKAHAVALPGMLLAYELALGAGPWSKRMRKLAPFVLLAGAFTWFTLSTVSGHLGGPQLGGSPLAAIASDGPIALRYLACTVAPVNLPFLYAVDDLPANSLQGWGAWASVGVLAAGSLAFSRHRRLLACAWLFGFAALAPALNLVAQPLPMADHYLHWALPGWLLGILLLVLELQARLKPGAVWPLRLALAGLALCWGALALLRVPDFRSDLDLFGGSVAKEPRAGWAWSRFALALKNSSAAHGFEWTAGTASRRALECNDVARVIPETLAFVIREAACQLYREGKSAEAWTLVERETSRFQGPAAPLAQVTRAYVAAHAGRPNEALRLLAGHFGPAYEREAAKLRERCRAGEVLPNALPPRLVLPIPAEDALDRESIRQLALQIQYILAVAYLNAHEVERAFDVAAVLVNMAPDYPQGREVLAEVYVRLGLPSAAERMRGGVRP